MALDDLGDRPIIVRSSSLLEDRMGTAFSGKYKSLFLANQGTKQERLDALIDAIAEVYASMFGPDPIEYRAERGLLDFHEEMGIMIQEVVGSRVGDYFLPAFAGVAFSNNEFRWSPRIKREDGLVAAWCPGLGTRAVDRVGDDYPVLIAPGQPGLRVNVTADEIVRYSPEKHRRHQPRTRHLRDHRDPGTCCASAAREYPGIDQIVSVYDGRAHSPPVGLSPGDFDKREPVRHVRGPDLRTPFVAQLRTHARASCRRSSDTPVDIEFASDGKDLYLLQCRPQSSRPATSRRRRSPRTSPPDRVALLGEPLRLQRPDARHHPHGLCRSRAYGAAREPRRAARRRARRRPAEQAAARSASSS